MCPDAAPEWTVSADELACLTELFRQFEGAADPLSVSCREAESEFNSLVVSPSGLKPARGERFKTGHSEVRSS